MEVEKILETEGLSDILSQFIFWDTYFTNAQGSINNGGVDFYILLCSWDSKCTRDNSFHFQMYLSFLSKNNMQNYLSLEFKLNKSLNNQTDTQ